MLFCHFVALSYAEHQVHFELTQYNQILIFVILECIEIMPTQRTLKSKTRLLVNLIATFNCYLSMQTLAASSDLPWSILTGSSSKSKYSNTKIFLAFLELFFHTMLATVEEEQSNSMNEQNVENEELFHKLE